MGKLLSNFSGVENFLAYEPIEQIAHLAHAGVMDHASAVALLRLNLDVAIYNHILGRNLNTRTSDSSSVNWALNAQEYHNRASEPDTKALLQKFKSDQRQPLFMTHECLRHANVFFSVAPQIRIIETVRHPYDLAYSCWKRGWGDRHGVDPLSFSLTIKHNDSAIPPYAVDWADDYLKLAPIDRVIHSFRILRIATDEALERLQPEQRDAILFVPYERLQLNPEFVVRRLGDFIKSSPLPGFNTLFEREKLTATSLREEVARRYAEIRQHAEPQSLEILAAEAAAYTERYDIDPLA